MIKVLTTTAIVLAIGAGSAHATGFVNPVTASVASSVASSMTNSKSTARSNAEQLAIINNKAKGGDATSANNDNSDNSTKVDGSYGFAFSFPPSAIGNGAWGSYGVGWNFFTSTYLSEEVLDANTVSNVMAFYADVENEGRADTLKKVLASYMCASERANVRAGGGLLFGDFGYSGCMTAAE